MTKTIQEIQKENRKFILEAIHGTSYEEALKKEIGFGCDILVQYYIGVVKDKTEILTIDKGIGICDITGLYVFTKGNKKPSEIIEIIGKPITLDRVLLAFKNKNVKINGNGIVFNYDWGKFCSLEDRYFDDDGYPRYIFSPLFDWDLELETLEEQSEETQRVINQLFTKHLIDNIKQ